MFIFLCRMFIIHFCDELSKHYLIWSTRSLYVLDLSKQVCNYMQFRYILVGGSSHHKSQSDLCFAVLPVLSFNYQMLYVFSCWDHWASFSFHSSVWVRKKWAEWWCSSQPPTLPFYLQYTPPDGQQTRFTSLPLEEGIILLHYFLLLLPFILPRCNTFLNKHCS
jgi:hypothetical protein